MPHAGDRSFWAMRINLVPVYVICHRRDVVYKVSLIKLTSIGDGSQTIHLPELPSHSLRENILDRH